MKKILVIEDESAIRANIQQILHLAGFDPVVAVDGAEGLELAKQTIPDLILCDVMMPKMDGYSVLKSIRSDQQMALIPFIFLTAKVDKSDIRQGIEIGGDDYLTKPFTPEELLNAINACFKKQETIQHHYQEEIAQISKAISSALSHELKTPLNGMILSAELIKQYHHSLNDEDIEEITDGFITSSRRLERLSKNFMLYANLELTTKNPEKLQQIRNTIIPCQTKNILNLTSLEQAKKWDREDDLQVDVEEKIIQISEEHFKKIVNELIDNAFKFSSPGTKVTITSKLKQNEFHLFITNEGRGMSPEQIQNIGPYLQFERQIYEQQGSGLGLAIVQKLLVIYHGKLSINSIRGKQTTVHIVLPINTSNYEDLIESLS
jgi:two-component system, sensor histidine kinase and response regulator